jgi:hypothetical protein
MARMLYRNFVFPGPLIARTAGNSGGVSQIHCRRSSAQNPCRPTADAVRPMPEGGCLKAPGDGTRRSICALRDRRRPLPRSLPRADGRRPADRPLGAGSVPGLHGREPVPDRLSRSCAVWRRSRMSRASRPDLKHRGRSCRLDQLTVLEDNRTEYSCTIFAPRMNSLS